MAGSDTGSGSAISTNQSGRALAAILGDEGSTLALCRSKRKPARLNSRYRCSSYKEGPGLKLQSGTGKLAYPSPTLAAPFGWTFSTRCSTNEPVNRGRRPGAKWPKTFR